MQEYLTDLSFLEIGKPFPIPSEIERMNTYKFNKDLYEGEHSEIFKEQFTRIQRIILDQNNYDMISYVVPMNYPRLISKKTCDLLLGETPIITAGKSNSKEQKTLDKLVSYSNLWNEVFKSIIDNSIFGDGLLEVYRPDANQPAKIGALIPQNWYKVVDPWNINTTTHHVFIRKISTKYVGLFNDREQHTLQIKIHTPGYIETRKLLVENGKITKILEVPKIIQTYLRDFAVRQLSNIQTSDSIYGQDDYCDIAPIVAEIEVQWGQIAKILDKHSQPSMQGPASAIGKTNPKTGSASLEVGNYFPIKPGEQSVSYVEMQGKLEANFTTIDKLINKIYVLSEMGSTLLGDFDGKGISSGEALRRQMISPMSKVARIRTKIDQEIKNAIILASQLGGPGIVDLTNVEINIQWFDGLPSSPSEDAVTIKTLREAGVISLETSIKMMNQNISDEDVALEIERINNEKQTEIDGMNDSINNDLQTDSDKDGE
jgi:hypothetical protein